MDNSLLQTGTLLKTRDGRKIGNAIVLFPVEQNTFLIKTDFGNEVILSEEEINALFFVDDPSEFVDLSGIHKLLRWFDDKSRLSVFKGIATGLLNRESILNVEK